MRKLIFLILIAAAGWFGWNYFAGAPAAPKQNPPVNVSVASATRADVPQSVSLVGNVIAYETVNIKSRIDSQIVDVLFHDGDNVKQGQTLFKLDDRALLAQMKQLEANVAKEKAQLQNDRLQYERSQKLIATKAVSQAQLDTTKAAYESQLAGVSATQASLDNTRVLLSYTTITAPISGRAGTINVTRGNNVKANDVQALVTINRVQPIRAQFAIPERYYAAVKAQMTAGGAVVEARREGSKDAAQGKLEYIDNTIDPNTGAFAARAVFENADEALWPGMFVQVALNLGDVKAALTIPAVAVQGDENAHFVFKVDANKKAVKTPVTVFAIQGTTAIISDGLSEGENVIIDGLLKVSDGVAVNTGAP